MARRDITGAVDFDYLETYAGGDAGLVEEVLGLFQEQAAIWMRLLDPRAENEAWRDAAHTIKGSARGVGAAGLADACQAAEDAADRGPAARDLALAEVRLQMDAVLSGIAAYRHEQALQSLRTPPR